MVLKPSIDFDTRIYNQIEADVKNLPQEFQSEFMRRTRQPIRNFNRRIKRPPGRSPAPGFVWSYNKRKQQRARGWWFAAIAGRIPGVHIQTSGGHYKRTGKLLKNTSIKFNRKERTIIATIPEVGKWVLLEQQIPSHKQTGWKRIDKELERVEVEMSDKAIEVWTDITDKIGE